MKKRKGFTFIEVLIALILLGLTSVFFLTIYTHNYRLDRVNKNTITTSYQGQENIENVITLTAGEAQRFTDFRLSGSTNPPAGLVIPQARVDMWGSSIEGYDIEEVVRNTDGSGTATIDVYSFIYANARKPALPKSTFITPTDKNVAPKFRYLEEFAINPGTYSYGVHIENVGAVRRAVTREYIGSRTKMMDNGIYVSRPYSDFLSDDSTVEDSNFFTVPYSSRYPMGYNLLSKASDASRGKVVIDAEGNYLDQDNYLSYTQSFELSEKEQYRDVQVLNTFQSQAVSGYTEDEKVIVDTATWLVGTPVINSLETQWDANLVYKTINLSTAGETVDRDIVSHTTNMIIVDNITDPNVQTKLNSVTELLGKQEKHSLGIVNTPRLFIKGKDASEFSQVDAPYRKYSAGIELSPLTNMASRLNIQDVGKTSLGNGRGNYSIIIRAKQIDPSKKSSLFSINMDNDGKIENTSSPNNEANQFFIYQNQLGYIADRGSRVANPSLRFHHSNLVQLHNSVYNNFAFSDERAGYHVFELQLKNMGNEDSYRMTLIVDGRKLYPANGAQPEWSDLDAFGIDIGSNLEVSDILVYSRDLDLGESSEMAKYLLNKYTVSHEEKIALKDNLDAIS